MTTAHRPTWKAAVGKTGEGGYNTISTQSSALDMAAHTKMKQRTGHQIIGDRRAILKASLLKLEDSEAKLRKSRNVVEKRRIDPLIEEEGRMKLLKQTAEEDVDEERIRAKYDDKDEEGGTKETENEEGWSDLEENDGRVGDNNDESDLDDSDSDLDDDSDDDEDEEAALQAELAKIRAEREAVKARERAEEEAEEQAKMEEAALMGNPLLGGSSGIEVSTGRIKRRWNDDVVFRNQARGQPNENVEKRFINDTIRNDFHKRFLNKFIR